MNNLTSHYGKVICLDDEVAHVVFERSDMCNHCNVCGIKSKNEMVVTAINEANAKVGDTVTVSFRRDKLLKASAIVYLIPLGLFIIGLLLGSFINELASIIISLVFCGSSFFILRSINKSLQSKKSYIPIISSIVTK